MNSGQKGVPPPGRPAPTGLASTQVTGTRINTDGHGYPNNPCESVLIRVPILARQARFQSLSLAPALLLLLIAAVSLFLYGRAAQIPDLRRATPQPRE